MYRRTQSLLFLREEEIGKKMRVIRKKLVVEIESNSYYDFMVLDYISKCEHVSTVKLISSKEM